MSVDGWESKDASSHIFQDMEGTIDLHIHSTPDAFPRLLNDLEVAKQARDAGMRAILLKGHATMTCDRAYIARQVVPGLEIYGGIVLNSPVGGINPEAVKAAIKMGAKAVWMPTMWAQNHVKYIQEKMKMEGYQAIGMEFPEKGITIFNEEGQVIDEVTDVLKAVAENDIICATSHLAIEEQKVLFDLALDIGVKKFVVTHPTYQVVNIPLEAQIEFAERGAFLEFCMLPLTPKWTLRDPLKGWSPRQVAQAIKKIGAKHCILSSDLGQRHNPPPLEGLREFVQMMSEEGISKSDLDLMTRVNPAKMLNL